MQKDTKHSPDELTFTLLREANATRAKIYPSEVKQDAMFFGLALAGEVGELCNLIKKQYRDGVNKRSEIADEIADVLIYLDLLAARYDIDIAKATTSKFNHVSDRLGLNVHIKEGKVHAKGY